MNPKIDPETRQKYKDMACKLIQESDEIEIDTDFGVSEGRPTESGYKTWDQGNRTDVFKVTKYKKQWNECTAGEALDAWVSGKRVQLKLIGYNPEFEWADVQHDNKSITTSVCWSPSGKYRKEA